MKVYKKIREVNESFWGQSFFAILIGGMIIVMILAHNSVLDAILILAVVISVIACIWSLWYENSEERLVETDMEVR